MLPFLPVLLFLDQFFGDMFLVALLLTGSYILFILYLNFREQPVIFGIFAIIAMTLPAANSGIMIILVAVFFVLVMFGQNLQMILQFSIYPLLGMFGVEIPGMVPEEQREAMKMQQIEQRILKGEEVSQAERSFYTDQITGQAKLSAQQQQLQSQVLRRRM
ncbi:MAG: hypothetical protein WC408_06980 [Candidatus Micrarchaeia archaeon]|jgi:hypothetical protein